MMICIKKLQSGPVTMTPDNTPDIDPDPDPDLSEIIEKRENIKEVDISTTLPDP